MVLVRWSGGAQLPKVQDRLLLRKVDMFDFRSTITASEGSDSLPAHRASDRARRTDILIKTSDPRHQSWLRGLAEWLSHVSPSSRAPDGHHQQSFGGPKGPSASDRLREPTVLAIQLADRPVAGSMHARQDDTLCRRSVRQD